MHDEHDPPAGPDGEATLPLDPAAVPAGDIAVAGAVIGPYRLVRRVGEGGMGEVFEAEQSEPIRRRVAVKVIKQGMDTRAVVARFEAERQALALMDHPCIARVYDAGATAQGRPYFAMEFVEGEPVTDYCNRRRLGTRERLDLFVRVCEGVQHAHQKAIIHRDLKPSNILVTEVDGRPLPKIIDFGVAKATTQRLTDLTMFTALGQMIGTPEYMSPEQAAASEDDIDTRTDVYALGVVLYELLVGALPFDSRELRKAGCDAIRRIICEQNPQRPSTRFSSLGDRAEGVARARGSHPKRLRVELTGDLDWITMKALEKDRNRRYETVNGLAADVRRHLRSEPVVAGPPSTSYRLGKLVRRNRRTFAALGAIAVVLVVSTVVSSVMYVRADRATHLARREAAKSQQVSRFLGDMLEGVGPQVAQGRDTELLAAILASTDARIGRELADQPEVEATLRLELSHTYREMGDFETARRQIDRVRELQSGRGVTSPSPAAVFTSVASLAWNQADLKGAEAGFRQALASMAGATDVDSLAWGEATLYLGNVLMEQGDYAAADSLMHRSLAFYRVNAPASEALAVNLNSLGNLGRYMGNMQPSEGYYREALAIHRKVLGETHPYVATDLHNLGGLLESLGRAPEAEQSVRAALAILAKVYPKPHADTAQMLRTMSILALGQNHFAQADSFGVAAYEMTRAVYGDRNEATLRARSQVADVLSRAGRGAEAEVILTELVAAARDTAIADPLILPNALYSLATTVKGEGRTREALPHYREAIELSSAIAGPDHPATLLYRNDYARTLAGLGSNKEALEQLEAVLAARERVLGAQHPETSITRVDLGKVLESLDRFAEAEASIRRGRDDFRAARGMDHSGGWIGTIHLATALRDLGRLDEAEKEFRAAEAFFVKSEGEGSSGARVARFKLASVMVGAGRTADAERLLAQAVDTSFGPVETWIRGIALAECGDVLLKTGKLDASARYLKQAYSVLEPGLGRTDGDTQRVIRMLARLCDAQGRPRDAAAWRARQV